MNKMQGFKNITLTAVILLAAAFTLPAQASPLSDARAAGQVTEISSGYVKAVGGDAAIKTLVADINKRRRTAYEKIARQNGVKIEQVAMESYKQRSGKN